MVGVRPIEGTTEEKKRAEEVEARRPMKTKDDVRKYGATVGCKGCEAVARGWVESGTRHPEASGVRWHEAGRGAGAFGSHDRGMGSHPVERGSRPAL